MSLILAIGAHPDDLEIGMGGTIAAMVKAGMEVVMLDLTDGEPTPFGTRERRLKEAEAAAKQLGAKRELLDLKNRELFDNVENRNKLAALYRRYKPDILFLPHWEDAHPDHIQASALGEAARFYAKFVKSNLPFEPYYPKKVFHYFASHLKVKVAPSFVFDISPHFEIKMKALAAYRSQFEDNEKNKGVSGMLLQFGAYWGNQVGVEYGEPFYCRENIKLNDPASLLNA